MLNLVKIFFVLLITVAFASTAHAIKCSDDAQVFKDGRQLVTPFCQDEYLAVVAREYGVKTSGRKIRANIHVKQEVCRVVGHDTRVSDNCSYLIDRDGRNYRR